MSHNRVTLAAIALTLMTARRRRRAGFGLRRGHARDALLPHRVSGVGGTQRAAARGYVYNVYDAHATRVRLSVEALDAAGRLLETRVVYVPLDVPPRGRSFFRAPLPPGTASARVSVLNFDWVPRGGGGGGM